MFKINDYSSSSVTDYKSQETDTQRPKAIDSMDLSELFEKYITPKIENEDSKNIIFISNQEKKSEETNNEINIKFDILEKEDKKNIEEEVNKTIKAVIAESKNLKKFNPKKNQLLNTLFIKNKTDDQLSKINYHNISFNYKIIILAKKAEDLKTSEPLLSKRICDQCSKYLTPKKKLPDEFQCLTTDSNKSTAAHHSTRFICVSKFEKAKESFNTIVSFIDDDNSNNKFQKRLHQKFEFEQVWKQEGGSYKKLKELKKQLKALLKERISDALTEDLTNTFFQTPINKLNDILDNFKKNNTNFENTLKDFFTFIEDKYNNGLIDSNIYKGNTLYISYQNKTLNENTIKSHNKSTEEEKHLNLKKLIKNSIKKIGNNKDKIQINKTESIKILNEYFSNSIRLNKSLSYNRFIKLFEIHQNYQNHIFEAINILSQGDTEKLGEIKNLVQQSLNPNEMTRETKAHRTTQGCHKSNICGGEPKDELKLLIKYLTGIDDNKNFYDFQAAHVIPGPGLFANINKLLNKSSSYTISKTFSEGSEDKQILILKEDINTIINTHQKNPTDLKVVIDKIVMIVNRIAFEKSSVTYHLPGNFNQKIDSISEFGKIKNKTDYAFKGKKVSTIKAYKSLLAENLSKMVTESDKTLKYSDILDFQEEYIKETKKNLCKNLVSLSEEGPSIENIILLISSINVFFGLKNAEAKGNKDFRDVDDDVFAAIAELEINWGEKVNP